MIMQLYCTTIRNAYSMIQFAAARPILRWLASLSFDTFLINLNDFVFFTG